MFLHIIEAEYLGEYRLRLTFNDDVVKDVDLKDELYGDVFIPLKDKEFFRQVRINSTRTTIEWPNGADFAPEYLYEIGKAVEKPIAA